MWAVVLLLLVLSLRYNFTGRELQNTGQKLKTKVTAIANFQTKTIVNDHSVLLEDYTFAEDRKN